MVYVIEIRSNHFNSYWVTWRYNQMEEVCNGVQKRFPEITVPKICSKTLMNQKTELIEWRLINFEIFF